MYDRLSLMYEQLRRPMPWKLNKKVMGVHSLVTGKTGSGKSTLLLSLIWKLLARGDQVIVIDPHQSHVDNILSFPMIQENKSKTAYFSLWDPNYLPCINPLYDKIDSAVQIDMMAGELSYVLSQVMGNVLTTQMETLLKPIISAMLSSEGWGLGTLQKLFTLEKDDPEFQRWIYKAPSHVKSFIDQSFHDPRYLVVKDELLQGFNSFRTTISFIIYLIVSPPLE